MAVSGGGVAASRWPPNRGRWWGAGRRGLRGGGVCPGPKRGGNRRFRGHVSVLFDGHCGLCRRSLFFVKLCDHLDRVRGVDYRDERARLAVAADLRFEDLDRAMHVRLPDGTTESGFDGVRLLARHLPVLWPLVPLLHLPGVAPLGRRVYALVAARRCPDGTCALHAAS